MAALRIDSVDMLRQRVNDQRAVTEVKGRLVWFTPKSYERRSVPFRRFLSDDLATLMVGKCRDDLVFSAREGGVLRLSQFRPRAFRPAVDRLTATGSEFPRVTPHDLRHIAASLAISWGANPKAVQTMLGHQSAALTLDTYADLFPGDLELVSAALDQAREAALAATADHLRTGSEQSPRLASPIGALSCSNVVGVAGFEPTASSSRTKRATKLRHTPLKPGQSIAPGQARAKCVAVSGVVAHRMTRG
jgi:Phage integrase family